MEGPDDRKAPEKAPEKDARELRYRTLTELEKVLRILVDDHTSRMTLGEMLAVTAAMARLCRQDQVTIAEIAEATGLPKQNLSRWARKRIGDSIECKVNEEDQRVHELVLKDAMRGQARIERLAEIFGTDYESESGCGCVSCREKRD